MKKLQIIRVDSDSVQKADLQIGDNIIGVEVVTGCKDDRVPKHAITINVSSDGEMTISPVAPCYIKSPGSSGWVKLDVGATVPIHVGDLFSLLSDKYWFKLITTDANMEDDDSGLKRKASGNAADLPSEKKPRQNASIEALLSLNNNIEDIPSSIGVDPGQEEFNPSDHQETAASSMEATTNDIYGASLPEGGKSPDTKSSTNVQTPNSRESMKSDEPNEPAVPAIELTEDTVQERDSEITCTGATGVDENPGDEEASKKIKWDCGQHFSDRSDHTAVHSSRIPDSEEPVQTASDSNPNNLVAVATVSSPPRNRCTYGSKCYRKNEEHRAQFSHPGDSDYEALDTRPECRYGIRCYRKNPQHRKDFKHTIQRRRRPQTPIRAKTPETSATDQSSFEESIDESEYEPSFCTDSSDEAKSDWDEK